MSVRIAPSLLAADFSRIAQEIQDVEKAGADLLHLDIMDGHFVPNLTFGPPVVRSLARDARIPLDAHLMVTDPDPLIPVLAADGVARIAVHVEACPHLHRTLQSIRDSGVEAGVAVNPASALSLIEDVLPWSSFILIMSVNPGFGGQDFIPESVERIRRLRRMAGDSLDISVDGGVCRDNAADLVGAGATTLIAGSEIFGTADRARSIAALRQPSAHGES
jgi:ribulose-phosphate 3-epimerase